MRELHKKDELSVLDFDQTVFARHQDGSEFKFVYGKVQREKVGDLNVTPWSWPFRNLLTKGETRNSQIGFGLQPTFAATSFAFLRVPIDHLLHSDALLIRDRRLGPSLGSDHFPLLVNLEYKGPPTP